MSFLFHSARSKQQKINWKLSACEPVKILMLFIYRCCPSSNVQYLLGKTVTKIIFIFWPQCHPIYFHANDSHVYPYPFSIFLHSMRLFLAEIYYVKYVRLMHMCDAFSCALDSVSWQMVCYSDRKCSHEIIQSAHSILF